MKNGKKYNVPVSLNGEGYKAQVKLELAKERIKKRIKARKLKDFFHIAMTVALMFLIVFTLVIVNSPETNAVIPIEETNALEVQIMLTEEVTIEAKNDIHRDINVPIKNIEEQAFNFIAKFEGYHDKPYFDFKQRSCGYGMKCSKNTTGITKEKSKVFVIERIKSIREKYELYKYDDGLEVALISFIYNIGHKPVGMEWYIENNHINALKNMMRKYSYAGGKYMRGLAKRRNEEVDLF